MVVAVDHHLGDAVVPDEGLDRTELLVVLVDVDARDPDRHSASLRNSGNLQTDRQLYIHARE